MSELHVFDHPLIQHKLSILRDKETSVKEFRADRRNLHADVFSRPPGICRWRRLKSKTPVAPARVRRISGKKLAVVPILRAGLGMVDGMVAMIPSCKVGHIGLYRNPETLEPVEYYCKLPPDIAERDVIIVDPMLATGGSAAAAAAFIKKHGCRHIKLMSIIGAPEGVKLMQEKHPDVTSTSPLLDERLTRTGHCPGLGDAGDRIIGRIITDGARLRRMLEHSGAPPHVFRVFNSRP